MATESASESKAMARPLASYSPARTVSLSPDVHLLYISGTTARQADGQIPPFGTLYNDTLANNPTADDRVLISAAAIQTDIILSKITEIINNVSDGPIGLEALVELTIFVKDLKRDYAAVNKIYDDKVGTLLRGKGIPLPARTCVEVKAMPPDERTLVEIKAVAKLEKKRNN
jgi:enamine deaminase RidA (YjgF/YER057c/UK114 family)